MHTVNVACLHVHTPPPITNDLCAYSIVSGRFLSNSVFLAGVQLQGVLDELCFYDGQLGATLKKDSVQLTVWAPTAQQVLLHLLVAHYNVRRYFTAPAASRCLAVLMLGLPALHPPVPPLCATCPLN